MCYYDITNNVPIDIPIDINFKMNKCNNEVNLEQKWLNEYKNINKEFIIVAEHFLNMTFLNFL